MSLIVQTVFANLIDWLFKPVDNLCSQLLTARSAVWSAA